MSGILPSSAAIRQNDSTINLFQQSFEPEEDEDEEDVPELIRLPQSLAERIDLRFSRLVRAHSIIFYDTAHSFNLFTGMLGEHTRYFRQITFSHISQSGRHLGHLQIIRSLGETDRFRQILPPPRNILVIIKLFFSIFPSL